MTSAQFTEVCAFRSKQKKDGAQIDLIIDRRDDVINLCECKFSTDKYTITGQYADDLRRKREVFWKETGTKKAIHMTMITANGLTFNAHTNDIQSEITLDDLFYPET